MQQTLLILTILLSYQVSYAQKFQIKNNDTLPYKEEMEIRGGDTVYLGTCYSFEKVNGEIINQMDRNCLAQGLWVINDSEGNYKSGNFEDGNQIGIWKEYDKNRKLLKETERITVAGNSYTVKEIDYSSGEGIVLIDKKFLAFYLKNLFAIAVILLITFLARIFINSRIYNIENGTNFSAVYGPFLTSNFEHRLLCIFSFWFSDYKAENKRLAWISNSLSIIILILFFGIVFGLAFTGELK